MNNIPFIRKWKTIAYKYYIGYKNKLDSSILWQFALVLVNRINRYLHMMRFTAFPEIQLNPGMRDIGDCQ
jgi:hypothetical protein